MKILSKNQLRWLLILLLLIPACRSLAPCPKNYDELITKLDGLTKKAQVALDEGYFDNDQEEGLEYIKSLNPVAYNWFVEKDYEIKVKDVGGHAVVLICKDGRPLFEDTDCLSDSPPDKDHTKSQKQEPCEFTMTEEEVNSICNY